MNGFVIPTIPCQAPKLVHGFVIPTIQSQIDPLPVVIQQVVTVQPTPVKSGKPSVGRRPSQAKKEIARLKPINQAG